jgi:hypothetical protein
MKQSNLEWNSIFQQDMVIMFQYVSIGISQYAETALMSTVTLWSVTHCSQMNPACLIVAPVCSDQQNKHIGTVIPPNLWVRLAAQ